MTEDNLKQKGTKTPEKLYSVTTMIVQSGMEGGNAESGCSMFNDVDCRQSCPSHLNHQKIHLSRCPTRLIHQWIRLSRCPNQYLKERDFRNERLQSNLTFDELFGNY